MIPPALFVPFTREDWPPLGGGLHAILPYRGRCPKTNRLLSQEAVRKAKLPCYMQPVLPRYA